MTWNNGLIEKYDLIMLNLPVVAEAGIELSRRITVPEAPEEIIYSGNSFTAVYAGIAYRLATEVYLSSRSGCKIKAIALWDTGASALYQGWKMPYSITETGEILISKDSRILRSFIIKMSQRTNSRDFIKGAVIAAGTENYLEQMIDYMDSHPEASFSEVMCFLYRIQGIIKE